MATSSPWPLAGSPSWGGWPSQTLCQLFQRLAGLLDLVFFIISANQMSDIVGPGNTLLTVTRYRHELRQPACQRELCRFGHAVVDHVRRDIAGRLGDNTTRPQLSSPCREAARERRTPDITLNLPATFPGVIVGGIEILRPVNPGIVDRMPTLFATFSATRPFRRAEIGYRGTHLHARHYLLQLLNTFIHRLRYCGH